MGVGGPAVSMGLRPEDQSLKESRNKPGPGTYDSAYDATTKRSPNTKIGTASRSDNIPKDRLTGPAPGTYD